MSKSSEKRMPSTFFTLTGVLVFIAGLCGILLAIVYGVTKDAIVSVEADKTRRAFEMVLPGFSNNPLETIQKGKNNSLLYSLTNNGQEIGKAILGSSSGGYGGSIELMVGIDNQGKITGISVLRASETPGLGSRISESAFLKQFSGNPPDGGFLVKKDGGTIDAIAAATISSRAVCDAVNKAFGAYREAGK